MVTGPSRVAQVRAFNTARPGSGLLEPREGARPGVHRGVVQLLLDAEQLVVLVDALAAGRRTGLELAGVGGYGEVRDGDVLGLATTVRDHRGVAVALVKLNQIGTLTETLDA